MTPGIKQAKSKNFAITSAPLPSNIDVGIMLNEQATNILLAQSYFNELFCWPCEKSLNYYSHYLFGSL